MRLIIVAAMLVAAHAQAAGVAGQGTWETTLQARDIDHDGAVDAYYDTELNITWLADANLAFTSGFDTQSPPWSPGATDWATANAWVQSLDLHGVIGWRLPHALLPSGCTEAAFGCSDAPSEMSHLFEHTLGGADNAGPFVNVGLDSMYWAGPLFSYANDSGPARAFAFSFANGSHGDTDELTLPLYAWGVHDGDVAPVPEPGSASLLLAGLGLLLATTRAAGKRKTRA